MKSIVSLTVVSLLLIPVASIAAAKSVVYHSGNRVIGTLVADSVEIREHLVTLKTKNQWSKEDRFYRGHDLSFPLETSTAVEQALLDAVRRADEISVYFFPLHWEYRKSELIWKVGEKQVVSKSSRIPDSILADYKLLENEIAQAEESLKNVFKSITDPDLSYSCELGFLHHASKSGFALGDFELDLKTAIDEFLVANQDLIINTYDRDWAARGQRAALQIWKRHFFEWLDECWVEYDTEYFEQLKARFWIVNPIRPTERTKDIATVRKYLERYERSISLNR